MIVVHMLIVDVHYGFFFPHPDGPPLYIAPLMGGGYTRVKYCLDVRTIELHHAEGIGIGMFNDNVDENQSITDHAEGGLAMYVELID